MKIISKRTTEKSKTEQKNVSKSLGSSESSFLEKLKKYDSNVDAVFLETDSIEVSDLENLAGMIEQLGETLSDHPTTVNFLKYKNYIKLFLNLLKENTEVVSTHRGYRKAPIITLQTIDKNLNELAESIMGQERNRLKFLKLTGDIKGLILDLIL